jgi:hypothetical protein
VRVADGFAHSEGPALLALKIASERTIFDSLFLSIDDEVEELNASGG